MKANKITMTTLVGFQTAIGVFGNCMSMLCDDGIERHIVNIGEESLKATGVSLPVDVEVTSNPNKAVITDPRIPMEAYRRRPCSICGGGDRKEFAEWLSIQ